MHQSTTARSQQQGGHVAESSSSICLCNRRTSKRFAPASTHRSPSTPSSSRFLSPASTALLLQASATQSNTTDASVRHSPSRPRPPVRAQPMPGSCPCPPAHCRKAPVPARSMLPLTCTHVAHSPCPPLHLQLCGLPPHMSNLRTPLPPSCSAFRSQPSKSNGFVSLQLPSAVTHTTISSSSFKCSPGESPKGTVPYASCKNPCAFPLLFATSQIFHNSLLTPRSRPAASSGP